MKKTNLIILTSILLTSIILPSLAKAQMKSIKTIDTPTAFTIGRGSYGVSMMAYDRGGFEFSTIVGLIDMFYFGVSLDFQNVIGQEKPQLNVPGVVAKLKIMDSIFGIPFFMAIGYDSFYIAGDGLRENTPNTVDRVIFGPYLVITQPIYLLRGEQYVSYGFRLPAQPLYVPDESSYFIALDFPITEGFFLKAEIERIFWNFRDPDHWLYNFGARCVFAGKLAIEFDFLWRPRENLNRVLRIEYRGHF